MKGRRYSHAKCSVIWQSHVVHGYRRFLKLSRVVDNSIYDMLRTIGAEVPRTLGPPLKLRDASQPCPEASTFSITESLPILASGFLKTLFLKHLVRSAGSALLGFALQRRVFVRWRHRVLLRVPSAREVGLGRWLRTAVPCRVLP